MEHIKSLAEGKNCTPAQLALAWVLVQDDDIVPIPGTKRVKYLMENVQSLNVNLTEAELAALDKLSKEYAPVGLRYTANSMKVFNLEE